MGNAIKDSINPFFKSKYADLNSIREACMPTLNKNGIVVLQPIVYESGKSYVQTVLLHESGEQIVSMTEIVCNKPNDAQSFGSGVSYARRYSLQSIVNVGAEDDDGNKASTVAKSFNDLPHLPVSGDKFTKAKKFIQEGGAMADIEKKYFLTDEVKNLLNAK